MKVEKAGTILINLETKKIGLIYRKKQNDYSFPKWHKEINETLIECAIRETNEETKRNCIIYYDKPIFKEHYFDSKKDEVDMYYYIAIDNGKSNNDSIDTHDLIWVNIDDVYKTLSYSSLKNVWNKVKKIVLDVLNKSWIDNYA